MGMKKKRLTLLLTLIVASLLAILPNQQKLFAESGCCRIRESIRYPWGRVGISFENCRILNAVKDGDNIYEPYGLVWWDISCVAR